MECGLSRGHDGSAAVKVVHYGDAEEAFASEDPFVRPFLSGESAGPLGMD
jgi:ABC-type transporter Mla maintaining outer membrane lipid asymmetry ATPase subunit MlaF